MRDVTGRNGYRGTPVKERCSRVLGSFNGSSSISTSEILFVPGFWDMFSSLRLGDELRINGSKFTRCSIADISRENVVSVNSKDKLPDPCGIVRKGGSWTRVGCAIQTWEEQGLYIYQKLINGPEGPWSQTTTRWLSSHALKSKNQGVACTTDLHTMHPPPLAIRGWRPQGLSLRPHGPQTTTGLPAPTAKPHAHPAIYTCRCLQVKANPRPSPPLPLRDVGPQHA